MKKEKVIKWEENMFLKEIISVKRRNVRIYYWWLNNNRNRWEKRFYNE